MSACSGMIEQVITLTLDCPGERMDKAIAGAVPDISRTQCQRLISEGLVRLDDRPVKASQRLKGGERVTIIIPPIQQTSLIAEPIPLDVQYEDKDILLINKPAGMVVHPAPGHEHGTLVNAILAYCPDLQGVGGERRPGIVHRLDKDTSGLIIVAKNDLALQMLQEQFKRREIKKVYLALVDGHFSQFEAMIDAPIGRSVRDRKRMAVISQGSSARSRTAQTAVKVQKYYSLLRAEIKEGAEGDFTQLECRPFTGRTHQIRVHLAFAGYPIVGDTVYGLRRPKVSIDRHFLHASSLTFRRPSDGMEMTQTISLPEELRLVLDSLAGHNQESPA
jgi:23S rRNA pseudouridine1911/1915/1917 synthase